ncbi:hypothetical protein evm_013040 [Chilo suppressalis]|nr:hypothetical protein evm_013040 [Chilo suppressalis]
MPTGQNVRACSYTYHTCYRKLSVTKQTKRPLWGRGMHERGRTPLRGLWESQETTTLLEGAGLAALASPTYPASTINQVKVYVRKREPTTINESDRHTAFTKNIQLGGPVHLMSKIEGLKYLMRNPQLVSVVLEGPIVPFSKVRARTAFLTGISERTVTHITRESTIAEASNSKIITPGKNRERKSFLEIDDFDKCAIRHMIQYFFVVKKETPTIHKLWLALKSDIDFKYSKTTLRRVLRSMGYKYKKCQSKRKVLMERYDIAAWGAKFILRMRKNRLEEKRPVIYLDETIYVSYHASYHVQNFWQFK